MTAESTISLLREFGFPVFVAMWFMWRLEKRVDRLFELMNALMQATTLLAKSVDQQRHRETGTFPSVQQGGGA
jgi:hypothetical protein